jgi:hypothetical protein
VVLQQKGRDSNSDWHGLWLRPDSDATEHMLTFGWSSYGGRGGNHGDVAFTMGEWHHVVGTFELGQPRLYLDGDEVLDADQHHEYFEISEPSTLGYDPEGGTYAGQIDEVRISSEARTAAWIATEHRNQRSPESFVLCGEEEPAP